MHIKKIFLLISLFTFLLILSGCSASTDIVGEWADEQYQKGHIDKLLVIGIFNKEKPLLRRKFEDGIAEAFNNAGINAVPSMDLISYKEDIDSTKIEKILSENEFDGVIVSRLVALEKNREYKAGYAYVIPYNNYYGFYGYYYSAVQYANSSGYLSKNVTVVLETNLYDAKDKKLIWSGISETVDPDKASDVINSLGPALAAKLSTEGFLAK